MSDIPFPIAVSAPAIAVGVVLGVLVYLDVLPVLHAVAALACAAAGIGLIGGRYAADPNERRVDSGGDAS